MSLTAMQHANRLQRVLSSGVAYGAWQMLPGHHHARVLARTGVDWIVVDAEHGALSDTGMHEAVAAIAGGGVSPLVRIPSGEAWMVKRALDAGAHGVVVPLVSTPEEARGIVASAKFPPRGSRGFGSPFPMEAFGRELSQEQYLLQANDALLTIVQIETQEALENVDAIASVDGIDVLFVGPYDLGNSIGHPIVADGMHPALQQAVVSVRAAAKKAGKTAGMFCNSGEQARMYAEQGFGMISVATDVGALRGAVANAVWTAKR